MALRGKKPEAVEKRLKALFYGTAGSGKTTAAIQFPRPYLIDTERGAENPQYVAKLAAAGGAYFFTTDFDTLLEEVHALASEKHEYRTVIIDPLTVPYLDMLDKSAEKVGTDFGRHKAEPDRKIKRLLALLLNLDMNVIITSHAKPSWVRSRDAKGKEIAVQEGNTFDCYGRLDYLFDLVFEVGKRGNERVGTVRKTRCEGFPEGDVFPFGYDEIANRYGREILERAAVAAPIASAEDVAMLRRMIADRVNGPELEEKWLKAAKVEALEDMTAEAVAKCINFLANGKAAA
jgi:hypothetical protein